MLLSNVVAAFLAGLAGFRKVVSRKSSARTEIKGRAAAAHVPSGGDLFSWRGGERRGEERCVPAVCSSIRAPGRVRAWLGCVRQGVVAPDWHATRAAKENEPPVGFEPTTSRLLSGCSAS